MIRQSSEAFTKAHNAHLAPVDNGDAHCQHCDANTTNARNEFSQPCDSDPATCIACCHCDGCCEYRDTHRRSYVSLMVEACAECGNAYVASMLWPVTGYGRCCSSCIEKIRDLGLGQ